MRLPAMWIHRTVATGLQTTHMNFTNVLCIVQQWQCVVQFILMALLGRITSRMRRDVQSLWIQSGTKSCWKHFCALNHTLASKICCGSSKMEQLLTQQKFPCKSSGHYFRADSFLISGTSPASPLPPRSPDHAVPGYFLLGYVTSKVYETRPANIADLKQLILECFQGIPKECYSVLWQPFLHECRSVLNDMVVTYEVSYSTVMTEINSRGHGMHPVLLIFFLRFALKSYFILKTVRCVWHTLCNRLRK